MSEEEAKREAEKVAKAKDLIRSVLKEEREAEAKADAERKAKEEADRKAAEEKKRKEEDDYLGVFGF